MRLGPALLFVLTVGACAGADAPPPKPQPLVVDQGADLKPFLGKRVRVRGYLLNARYKGFPHLYAGSTKEEPPLFLVSIPDSIDWRSRLKRELIVVGVVDELPPFTEEQRKPGRIPQGYPSGAIFVRVETLEDATSR